MQHSPAQLSGAIKQRARELGFSLAGICPATNAPGYERLLAWLSAGYAGEMHYLPNRAAAYRSPESILDGARSVVMLAMNYHTAEPPPTPAGFGRIARYAWGDCDYHDLIHNRLRSLVERVSELAPQARARGVVDTAPLLEREFAQLAGLGWIGKNTLLLNRDIGSWFFLAALVVDCELESDLPFSADHCGTCTACLDACPTQAFPQPYVLDATKCVSYLTIELRDDVPLALREGIGDWLFGCDICQEVCPWNRRSPETQEAAFAPREDSNPVELIALFSLDDAAFRQRFRQTPLWRSKRRGILRNAAIVLGNQRFRDATPVLAHAAQFEVDEMIRAACEWALTQIEADK